MVDAGDPQGGGEVVGLGDIGKVGLLGGVHDHHDAQDGGAQENLDHIGGQGQTDHGAGDGHGRGDQGHRQGEAQAGQVGLQEAGAGGQGTGQGDQKTGAADEIQVKGEKAADDRHEEHAATDPAEDGDDTHDEGYYEQQQGPDPPSGVAGRRHGHEGCFRGCASGLIGQGQGRSQSRETAEQQPGEPSFPKKVFHVYFPPEI
jgi:hypothetical protein